MNISGFNRARKDFSRNVGIGQFSGTFIVFAIIGLFIGLSAFLTYNSLGKETFTPSRVYERVVADADGGSKTIYMVDTKNKDGVYAEYTIKDSIWLGHFTSGTLKNKINDNTGREITCKVSGYRIPFLSIYKNIYSCNI